MSAVDRQLLTAMQQAVPLVPEPYAALGQPLGLSGAEIIAQLQRLKALHILRQVSGIFDTKSLGYRSTLVAMRVAPEQLEQAAAVINKHPGVSHNYRRRDEFNLWFTVASPPHVPLEETIHRLHALSGALRTLILPTLRLYKIGVKFNLTETKDASLESPEEIYDESRRGASRQFTQEELTAMRILQEDLPLVPRPFAALTQGSGVDEAKLFNTADVFQRAGYLRRYAAILHHREAGFLANAMVVWQIPEERLDDVGTRVARFREVSHCYRRPVFPDWAYPLFAMVHAPTYRECLASIERIEQEIGAYPRKILLSTKEYKKIRLKYFTQDYDDWWAQHGTAAPAL